MKTLGRLVMVLAVVTAMGAGAIAFADELDGAPTPTYCPNGTPC